MYTDSELEEMYFEDLKYRFKNAALDTDFVLKYPELYIEIQEELARVKRLCK